MRASRSVLSSLAFGLLLVAVLIGTGLPLKLTAQQAPVSLPTAGYVMSGFLEQAWLQRHGLLTVSPAVGQATPEAPSFTPQFWPASYNVTRTPEQEVETQVLTASAAGTEYTIITYMRYQGSPTAIRTRYRKLNGVMTVTDGEFATPGYTWAGDPSLDANLYGGGVSPGRIYNAAALTNIYTGTTAIGVWYSDNQGSSWTGPTIIATESTAHMNVDFPTLVVSPHQGTQSTLGYVYVIYLRTQEPPLAPYVQLYVAKSTDGGVTFGAPSLVTSGTRLGGTQLLVAGRPEYRPRSPPVA